MKPFFQNLDLKPHLLIFDMDGTFVDSRVFHTKVFHRFLNRYVGPISLEKTRDYMGNTVRHIFRNLNVPEEQLPSLFNELTRFCTEEIDEFLPYVGLVDGIVEALDASHENGFACVLLTNSLDCTARKILDFHNLLAKFIQICGATPDSIDKVSRCREIIKQHAVNAHDVICIGDSEHDIEMANHIGCRSCFVQTNVSWYRDKTYIFNVLQPTYTVTSLHQIPQIFYSDANY